MAAVIILNDFRAQGEEICHYFHLFSSICHEVMGPDAMILAFLIFSFDICSFTFPHHPHQEAF